ncbi:vesicle coat component [Mortierella sp. 14UC]|nr:vesicle coat component [Mortierella sp. 14UC]
MARKQFARLAFAATVLLALTSWIQTAQAIKFSIAGQDAGDAQPFCVSHYVDSETQVVVKVKVHNGPHQKVSVEVTDDTAHQGQLWKKDNLSEELQRGAFLNKEAGNIVACFTNVLASGYKPDPKYTRVVDVDFDIGSETIDYLKLAEKEKLKPMEVELRKLEDMVRDVIENMEHLQQREEKMRNTNESTNARVQWFSTMTMVVLIALGAWQIVYLKQFFRKKRLID